MRKLHAEHAARYHARRFPRIPIIFHDFFPSEERTTITKNYCQAFKAHSFVEAISTCQCYEARLNDRRRIRNVSYMNPEKTFTGIDFKSTMVANGQVVPSEKVCLPQLDEERYDKLEADQEEAEAGAAAYAADELA